MGHWKCDPYDYGCAENEEEWVAYYNLTKQLPSGNYIETRRGGFIDRSHIRRDWARRFLDQVRDAVGRGGPVEYEDGLVNVGPIHYVMTGNYTVLPGLTEDQVEGVALGMFEDYIRRWEGDYQGIGGCVQRSCFAPEDLPSFYLGFYMESREVSLEQVVHDYLGGLRSVGTQPPHGGFPIAPRHLQNRSTTPMINAGPDPWGQPQWVNVPWPDALTITPIGSNSGLWRVASGTGPRPIWRR